MRISEHEKRQTYLGAFKFSGLDVRVYGTRIEPWFVLEDVRRAAGLPEDTQPPWGHYRTISDDAGGRLWLTDELGLWTILLAADTRRAYQMAERLQDTVLPRLRRYGTVVAKSQ